MLSELNRTQYHKDKSKDPITDSNLFKFTARFSDDTHEDGIGEISGELLKYL